METQILIFIPTLILGAILLSISNPLYMIITFIGILLHISLLILCQGLTFLALLFAIIYVGAIAILFLFIIFLLNLKNIEPTPLKESLIQNTFSLIVIYSSLITYILAFPTPNRKIYFTNLFMISEETDNLSSFTILYNEYSIYFISITIILLLAMISVILITKDKKQQITQVRYKHF